MEQIRLYFATLPPYEDDATLQACLGSLVPCINIAEMSIAQMQGARTQRTLHKKITHEPPATTSDWAEYGTASKVVDGFFKFLLSTPIDAHSQCISKLPFKRAEMEIMRGRIAKI